jgi:hypothetical protein
MPASASHHLRVLPVDPEHVFAYWSAPASTEPRFIRWYSQDGQLLRESPAHGESGQLFAHVGSAAAAVYAELGSYEGSTFREVFRSSLLALPQRHAGLGEVKWRRVEPAQGGRERATVATGFGAHVPIGSRSGASSPQGAEGLHVPGRTWSAPGTSPAGAWSR